MRNAALCVLLGLGAAESQLGWQAHSYNDLRLWPQLPQKLVSRGLLSVKVDPHGYASDGSFKLSHNKPTTFGHVAYNTTSELLTQASELLGAWPDLSLRVALCFKKESPCSVLAARWRGAVDKLFNAAEALRSNFPGRLEFVLDGAAKPQGCMQDRWRPWNATWIPGDHSPDEAFTSDDASKGFDRYQVLNPPDDSGKWAKLNESDYGKFLRGRYPMQLWEPDSQDVVRSYADMFLSGPGAENPELGFDYAINIDPAMWTIFSAQASKAAWNNELQLTTLAAPRSPSLLPMPGGRLVVLAVNDSSDKVSWATLQGDALGDVASLGEGALEANATGMAACEANGQVHLFAGGRHLALSMTSAGLLVEQSRGAVKTQPLAARSLSSSQLGVLEIVPAPGASFQGFHPWQPTAPPSALEILSVPADPKASEDATVLWTSPALPGGVIVSADFLAMPAGGFLAVASDGANTYAILNGSDSWRHIGAGSHVSLAKLLTPEDQKPALADPVIALNAGGGYCFNSHSHNTGEHVKVCDQTPTSCSSVLDYSVGRLSQWRALLASGALSTPCGPLLHGSYDFGGKPSVALLPLPDGRVAFASVHEGAGGSEGACGCGSPTPRPNRLVLDGFALRLPQLASTVVALV